MDRIEEIWDKGNEQISKDKTVSNDFIIKSISETSISISSKLPKIIWFGIVLSVVATAMLIYNISFYLNNTYILSAIIVLLIIIVFISGYLFIQLGVIKNMDLKSLDLRSLLVNKVKYLNTQFQTALHCVSLTVVFTTFTINLTMENGDGIFEIRKILLLSIFYLFTYIISFYLYKIMYSVYLDQLENALFNLEENTFKSFDNELKKHKRKRKIIGIIIIALLLAGIIVLWVNAGK